jgi:hypothetical protein
MRLTVRCEVCCTNIAQVKDYRHDEEGYTKYLVCPNCFILNDKWFFKLKYAKEGLGKKKILSQIIEGTWKEYLINE